MSDPFGPAGSYVPIPSSPDVDLRVAVAEREASLHLAAFQQAPVPLVLVEADGTVRSVNSAASLLCDTSLGTPTGHPVSSLLGAQNREVLEEAGRRTTVDHEGGQWTVQLGNTQLWLVGVPLAGPDAEGVGLLALLGAPAWTQPLSSVHAAGPRVRARPDTHRPPPAK